MLNLSKYSMPINMHQYYNISKIQPLGHNFIGRNTILNGINARYSMWIDDFDGESIKCSRGISSNRIYDIRPDHGVCLKQGNINRFIKLKA